MRRIHVRIQGGSSEVLDEILIEVSGDNALQSRHRRAGRVDFHLHSYASNVTDYYGANAFSIPESYSDPIETYHKLKSRGMSLVTLTDHNSIEGAKIMLDAGLPDVFISAEMTTTFPEDGCNIHVTAANISEDEFSEIDRLRPNVYEMIAYLDERIASEAEREDARRIAYFMTHPLMSTQNRPYGREGGLSLSHIERALLMFECIEIQNGARSRSCNDLTAALVDSLDKVRLERLANKHGIEPKGDAPWKKAVVGGSDDHSGINPGRTWTEFYYEGTHPSPNDVIDSIRHKESAPAGIHGGPVTLAHALVKLIYDGQHSEQRAPDAAPILMGDSINLLLGFAFERDAAKSAPRLGGLFRVALDRLVAKPIGRFLGRSDTFEEILLGEARSLLTNSAFRTEIAAIELTDDKIFHIIRTLLDRLFIRYTDRLRTQHSGNVVAMIKEAITLVGSNVMVSLPYFVSYAHSSTDKLLDRDVREAFEIQREERLVLVTDTLFDVNGVAITIRKIIREAENRKIDFTVATCLADAEYDAALADPEIADWIDRGRLRIFRSIVHAKLPEYDDLQVRLVSFLEFLRFAQESGFTKMQISTPGPVGVAGLMAAKLLGIETSSTYHTAFPEYVEAYTQDIAMEAMAWKYMIYFYHAVDEVVVPSKFIANLLRQRGLRKRNLLVLDRWVDLDRFSPKHRVPGFWSKYGLEDEDEYVKFIYVGRVGAEKNLEQLADAYRRLHEEFPSARLMVVGDGPYRREMEARLEGLPAIFAGFLDAPDVARALASSDAKVFPSTTDTWGNAPLEAQAAGLPVIVTDKGGPQELMEPDLTGFRVAGGDVDALHRAMRLLMDPELRIQMGVEARGFVEANDIPKPYSAILDADGYRRRRKTDKRMARLRVSSTSA